MAASLSVNQLAVTTIFPDEWLVARVFPEPPGRLLTDYYRSKGIAVVTQDVPVSVERSGNGYVVRTRGAKQRLFNGYKACRNAGHAIYDPKERQHCMCRAGRTERPDV